MKKKHLLTTLTLGLIACAAHGAMVVGDTVTVNFTRTTDIVGGNWNEWAEDGSAYTADINLFTDLVRLSDGTGTGVSLAVDLPNNSEVKWGIGGADVAIDGSLSFPVSGTIPDNAQQRLSYFADDSESGAVISLVFGGLNNSLTYDFSFLSKNSGARDALSWTIQPGLTGVEASILVDPNDAPFVHTFAGVATNGAGQIILRSAPLGAGAVNQHINALELTAVPEPATWALLAGLGVFGLALWRRRR